MEQIKELMKTGNVKVAADELKKRLAADPNSTEAKMLYGTCCHLLGDDKTFAKIHDELAPMMYSEKDEKTLSLWQKYHKLWMTLIVGGLVLSGVVGIVWYFGNNVIDHFSVVSEKIGGHKYGGQVYQRIDRKVHVNTLYAAAPYDDNKPLHFDDGIRCSKCNGTGLATDKSSLCEKCGGHGRGYMMKDAL